MENPDSEYFIGSLVVCPSSGSYGSSDLIDGQQRVTTLFIILCAIRDRLSFLGDVKLNGIKKNIADVDTDQNGNDCFRAHLEPQYEDAGDAFKSLIEGKRIEKKDTLSIKNISIAYETSKKFFVEELDDNKDEIRKFFGYLIKNVKLIKIYTESFGKALKIFETINDRGKGLNSMDLLKNLLFMNANDSQFESLKSSWKHLMDRLYNVNEQSLRFLRYFIFATWGVPRLAKDEIYDWLIKNDEKTGLKDNPVGFTKSLEHALDSYVFFLKKKDKMEMII